MFYIVLIATYILAASGTTLVVCKHPNGRGIFVGCTRRSGALLGDAIVSDGDLPISSKIQPLIDQSVVMCFADNSRDIDMLKRELKRAALDYEVVTRRKMPIRSVSSLARHLIQNKYRTAHVVIAGKGPEMSTDPSDASTLEVDPLNLQAKTPNYNIYEIFPGGGLVEQRYSACLGTGSSLIASDYFDTSLGRLAGSKDPKQFIKDTLNQVSKNDIYSGGKIDIVNIL